MIALLFILFFVLSSVAVDKIEGVTALLPAVATLLALAVATNATTLEDLTKPMLDFLDVHDDEKP